ncbi:MAG TPA: ComEC/Rec2 family competence protein [Ohtaekwangia sp.]|uniref:ComEC/Rec2 family competence protein n=1 Tax=Ohtaekwangia sp. TaxID=2066019 RepID=UPI002F950846
MLHWIPFAVVRIVLFFIAGILLGIYLPDFLPQFIITLVFVTLLIVYIGHFIFQRITRKALFNPGAVGLLAILLAGYLQLLHCTDSRRADNLINLKTPVAYYQTVVTGYIQEKANAWKVEARVMQVKSEDEWKDVSGNILLYFPKKDFPTPFQYGDVLLIRGQPQEVPVPGNPGEFDYKRFLTFRKIYHQHFVKYSEVKRLESRPDSHLLYYAICARTWADAALKKFVTGEREQAIASALVLGVTDGLDNELLNAYAATGAMHVLAVSGLHISIIYMIILWLLKPLGTSRTSQWVAAGISLVILWGYAYITGLSPSVLRAVTMFTFVAVARAWNRQTNIYNILAASAFFLLIYEPYLIMSVAFQLSYLAVLGIVYLKPDLYQLWEPASRLWDEVWKITTVSIAAQLATLSLGLLYFHQFPNYFLLSNLLVIPGSFFVLIAGLVVLCVSFMPPVAAFVGILLKWSIQALNIVVFTVEAFPFSLVDNIYINTAQSWLLMAVIVSMVLLFQFKAYGYIWVAAVCSIMFVAIQWFHFYSDVEKRYITVYKVPHHSAVDLTEEGQVYFMTDSLLMRNASAVRFHIHPNRLQHGVEQVIPVREQTSSYRLLQWQGKFILQIMGNKSMPSHIQVDYLIISNNAVKDLAALLKQVEASEIILDSSNSYYFASKLLKQASAQNIRIHSVWHTGAFSVEI